MRIVHLCLEAPYTDLWGYQENLLGKYHRKQGHDVTVITTNQKHDNGKLVTVAAGRYDLPDGQHIIRLNYDRILCDKISRVLRRYPIYDLLMELKPDFVMVHGLMNCSVLQLRRYIQKHCPTCRVIADNHVDDFNATEFSGAKGRILIALYRWVNRRMRPFYRKVYGVTPGRTEYQQRVLGIAEEVCACMPMGADDESIHFAEADAIRKNLRKKHGIGEQDFLLITGGRIDEAKKIDLLLQAVTELNRKNLKLIVFGTPNEAMRSVLEAYADHESVRLIGWLPSEQVYDYYLASDLIVFPGSHSVMWEQACACGVPAIFARRHGMEHVDLGGNCLLWEGRTAEDLKAAICRLADDPVAYGEMLEKARTLGISAFSYAAMAENLLK